MAFQSFCPTSTAFLPFEFVRVKGYELSLTNDIILKRFALAFVASIAFIRTSIFVHYGVHSEKYKFFFNKYKKKAGLARRSTLAKPDFARVLN